VTSVSLKEYIRKVIKQPDRQAVLRELSELAKGFGKPKIKEILAEIKKENSELKNQE